ncbi:MAG: reverse transcriptase domain-containing protein, partial [Pseudomonadota bacterium]
KLVLEPQLEPVFLADSYGYRPGKSALDAVAITRKRCWQYDWVLEFDIKGLFDHIDHTLLLKAVSKHTQCRWVKLYIERWLTAPLQLADGRLVERTRGTPQGGVVSPLLANLFLHYAFDAFMARTFPDAPWCRYADDGLVHCKTQAQAQAVMAALKARFAECGLEMHADKTQIIYCKDVSRKETHPITKFDFLGFTFRPRLVKNRKRNSLFVSFTPAVSSKALKDMRATTRRLNCRNRTHLSLRDIARLHNPILRGWIAYYGRFYPSALYPVFR